MSWLLIVALKNAVLVLPLAVCALAAGRWARRPALAHLLWALVLVKLLTPPLVNVPVGWKLDFESLIGNSTDAPADIATAAVDQKPAAQASSPREARRAKAARRPGESIRSRGKLPASWHTAESPAEGPAARWRALLSAVSQITWANAAVALWLGGSLAIAAMVAVRGWRFCRYVDRAERRDPGLAVRAAELAHAAGVAVAPRVVVVEAIVSPMLWGLGRNARIVFPARLAGRLSPAKLDALLLHELAHFARGDHWVRAVELAAFVLFWWHPVVWLARREIEAAQEECCDAWVVEHQSGTRHTYAEAILTTIDFLCERPPALPPAACGLGHADVIRLRLTQIMKGESPARLSRALQAALLAIGLAISPMQPALWAISSPAIGPSSTDAQTVPAVSPNRFSTQTRRQPVRRRMPGDRRSVRATAPAAVAARRLPLTPPAALWAAADSPDGKYRLEARSGRRTTLASLGSEFRLDLSSHRITCASFAPDSRTFATGHEDRVVRLWDAETGGLLRSFRGSQAPIVSVHVSFDGKLAAGAEDGSVQAWDLTSGDLLAQLPPGDAPVNCVRWSKRGDRLAIGVGAWSQRDEARLLIWAPQESVLVAEQPLDEPVGALGWLGDDEALIAAAWNGDAIVWSTTTSEMVGSLQMDKDKVSAAAWSADCPLVSSQFAERFGRRAE